MKYKRGGACYNDDGTIEIPEGAILFEKPFATVDYERVDETHVRSRGRLFLSWMEPVKE